VAALRPDAHRAARVASRVLRLPVLWTSCLPTSIALAKVLLRHRIQPDIVLGVSATGTRRFAAHAWVEASGHRLDPSEFPPGRYKPAGRFRLVH